MNQTSAASHARVPTLRFSTGMFAPRERVAAWREFVGIGILKLNIDSYSTDEFRADCTLRTLPGLNTIAGSYTAALHEQPQHMVHKDDFLLAIARIGKARFAQGRREAISEAGDAVLVGGGEGGLKETHGDNQFIALQIPRQTVVEAVSDAGDLMCRRIPAQTPALQLLRHYLGVLDNAEVLATPALQCRIATHIHDLVTLAVGATRDAAELAKARGARAARLHAIMTGIEQHLENPELSAAWLGAQLGLSDRYVHHLLAGAGDSFSELVRRKRIERARRMLEQPDAPRRIIDVAFSVGFGDLSTFNRAFRQQFGCTPSDVLHRRVLM